MTTVRLIGTISLPTSAVAGQVLTWNGSGWAAADAAAGSGTVKKVNGVDPDGSGAVTLTKANLSLGNVDNTSDANKPVSTAQQTALDLKAPLASPTFTGTVSGVTKAHVGLGNVDNTSDANKPVSTAQQTALDGKAALSHTHTASQVSDSTTVGRAVLTAADAPAARTAIGAGTSSLVIGTTSGTAADASATATSLGLKANDASVVHVTGTETVAGVKTFTSQPVVPTPTTSTAAANKAYVDSAVQNVGGVYTVMWSGGAYPTQPASPPGGVVLRQFFGPQQYQGATWAGVLDTYTYAELT